MIKITRKKNAVDDDLSRVPRTAKALIFLSLFLEENFDDGISR